VNAPQRPLSPDIVDELLSAELDGEFDRAAADLGFNAVDARTALDAAPGIAERRAALNRARERLAERPVLEAERETHLISAAIDRLADDFRDVPDRRRWFSKNRRALVAAAAAAAVVAAIVVVAATNRGSDARVSTASPIPTAPHRSLATRKPQGNISFGDVTDANTLRAKVRAKLNGPAPQAPSTVTKRAANPTDRLGSEGMLRGDAAPQGPTGAAGVTGTQGVVGPQGLVGDAQGEVVNGIRVAPSERTMQACLADGERDAQLRSVPVLAGTGTVGGRPVIIVVFAHGTSYLVYELNATDCSVMTRQTLP
jgi:hypothetical protein